MRCLELTMPDKVYRMLLVAWFACVLGVAIHYAPLLNRSPGATTVQHIDHPTTVKSLQIENRQLREEIKSLNSEIQRLCVTESRQ